MIVQYSLSKYLRLSEQCKHFSKKSRFEQRSLFNLKEWFYEIFLVKLEFPAFETKIK